MIAQHIEMREMSRIDATKVRVFLHRSQLLFFRSNNQELSRKATRKSLMAYMETVHPTPKELKDIKKMYFLRSLEGVVAMDPKQIEAARNALPEVCAYYHGLLIAFIWL